MIVFATASSSYNEISPPPAFISRNLSSEKIKEEFLQREESATEAERQFLRDPEVWT